MPARPIVGDRAPTWSRRGSLRAVAAFAILATASCSLTSDLDSLTSGSGAPRKGGSDADGGDDVFDSDGDATFDAQSPSGQSETSPTAAPDKPDNLQQTTASEHSSAELPQGTVETPVGSGETSLETSTEREQTDASNPPQPTASASDAHGSTTPPQPSRPQDASACNERECTAPALVHRFSFSDIPAISDSVGGADGTVVGLARATNGSFVFDGDTYITLPTRVLDKRASATLEAWFTSYRTRAWERIFDAGESQNGSGRSYLFFTPQTPSATGTMRLTFRAIGQAEVTVDSAKAATDDVEVHVAVVVDAAASRIHLYHNGQLSASGTTQHSLLDVNVANVWLGRSLFSGDPLFEGELNELRIYDGALSDADVAASFEAGPDAVLP